MNKKILIVLGVSLALNFLFIGFEVSRAVFEPPFPSGPAERFKFRPEGFPPPDGREVRADENKKAFFGAFKKAMKDARKPMKASKEAVTEALRKDPFDPAALQKALDEASAVRKMIDDAVQKNMLDMISKMTPEERAAFAESFEKGPRFRKHRRPRRDARAPMPPEAGMAPPPPPERREPPFFRHHRRPPMHHPEMMPPHGLPPCMRDARDGRRFMPDDYPCAAPAERMRKGKPIKPEKGGKAKPAPQEGSTPQK